ncbi:MAG TPA: protein kinase, partial [Bryobacteraceae bacterium]|nr:protein kinase [Bryobacteraceae bacterium]
MPMTSGERLGQYEILAPIGAGGMGEVYRARDTKLKRDVAIKVLPDSFAHDPDRMARFQREAEVLASLNHPNIAQIYGVEERALVMELVEGDNLKGPLPIETAIHYASQIALALEAAHAKGIVHRDLKPANIKLTPAGVVKVLDFGLAAVTQPSSPETNPANSPTLTLRATQAGLIMGTAAYMSPEQAAGKPVDHRADIWSFGVVLWELLTGRQLYDGETVSHTLAAVLTKDPDWTQLPAETPANIRRLLHRCLERDLKRRLRDIGDAWIELNAPREPATAPPAREQPLIARWLPWVIAAAVAIAAVGWAMLRRPVPQSHQVFRWSFTQENPFGMPAISRDGSRMAYSEFSNGTVRLVLRMLDQPDALPIAGTETGGVPTFSPDGQWIAYFSGFIGGTVGSKLQKVALGGGTPVTICTCPGGYGVSWGDDDAIVFSDSKRLFRVPSAGGTAQVLSTPDAAKGEVAHVFPFVMPGAHSVLFAINRRTDNQVAELDLRTGAYRVLANGINPQYLSNGLLTYVRSAALYAAPFNAKRLAVTGPETLVIDGIGAVAGGSVGEYSVSTNGTLVYMAGQGQGGKSVMGWVDRN